MVQIPKARPLGPGELRRELSARNLHRAGALPHEVTFGSVPSVIYAEGENGGHGNFLPAAFRRIVADAGWARRLGKAYTASRRVPRAGDRRRSELECANSSDALLMNIFCYPGVLRRPGVCRLLGLETGLRPEFGVRVHLPLAGGKTDRTEADMRVGECLFEAKLTETGFQSAPSALVERYQELAEVFEAEALPRLGERYASYQLVRGTLAAARTGDRYTVLCDGRRRDMGEEWFRVMRAVRSAELRSRLLLVTWQELAAVLPRTLQVFLAEKYGIIGAAG